MATPEANRNRLKFARQQFNEQKLPKKKGRYCLITEPTKDDYNRIDGGLRITIMETQCFNNEQIRARWRYDGNSDSLANITMQIKDIMQ